MANNRLYIVDTETNEFICIAKGGGCEWNLGNAELLKEFLATRFNEGGDVTNLKIGTENDADFYDEHLAEGENFNIHNKWTYK